MTAEEKREHNRQWYRENREKVCAKHRARYKKLGKRKKEQLKESKRKWLDETEGGRKYKERKIREYNSEEYRAKRRAEYAAKHAHDPMTEHRRRCIVAAQERMQTPLEDRKAKIEAEKAMKAAKRDMVEEGFIQAEEESERSRETVIKYIDQWTQRKIFATQTIKNGELMSEADVRAYHNEACKYFELQKRLDETDPRDYSTRNILSYKLRVIEDHFNTLLNKKLSKKSKLKTE